MRKKNLPGISDPILLHDFFEKQVVATPENIAIQYHNEKFTYQELENVTNQLAHYLCSLRLPTETPIPIIYNTPILYVISLLAILKSGHCYVPLSPKMPIERLNLILNQLKCPFFLTDTLDQAIIDGTKKAAIIINDVLLTIKNYSNKKPDIKRNLQMLAYMIFTSGSTGIPKGVLMEHRGPVNIIKQMCDISSLCEKEFFIQNVNFSFDPHIWTLFWPLSVGATVILQNESEQHDGNYLIKLINQFQISVLHSGVSLTKALLKLPDIIQCKSLKQIIGGGEAWSASTFNELLDKLPQCELVNVYGPTETCVHATFWRSSHAKNITTTVPIGKAITNYQIVILDEHLNKVPDGEKGQIYIGGAGLARGYYGDEETTTKKFIPNPFSQNTADRLYQSGDSGRVNHEGEIEFLGRIDEQVQIRGHRVELGEIETTLNSFPGIANTAILAANLKDDPELIAFVELKDTVTDSKTILPAINLFLQQKLPHYMLPKKLILINEWPLTSNGKIDKYKLLEKISKINITPILSADDDIKTKIFNIWCNVLNVDHIQDNDDFFQVGGDSLNALDIIAKINNQFSADFSLSAIFDHPTLEKLTVFILKNQEKEVALRQATNNLKMTGNIFNLSLNQKRLIRLASKNSALNNGIIPLQFSGQLDISTLKKSATTLTEQHEILRANLLTTTSDQMIIAKKINDNFFNIIDLTVNPEQSSTLEAIFSIVNERLEAAIEISSEPLFQITIIHCKHYEYLILVYLNHIIADSYTGKFIIDNLISCYQSLLQGKKQPPVEPNQYRNYIIAEERFYKSPRLTTQLNFWLTLLANQPRLLNFNNHEAHELTAGITSLSLTKKVTGLIREMAIENKVSLFTILITLFANTLYNFKKQKKFILAFTYSLRDKQEFQGMLGPLSNKLLLPINFEQDQKFSQLLKQVSNNLLEIYKNSDIQLEALRDSLIEIEGESFTELFNVIFDYEKETMQHWQIDAQTTISSLPMPESSQVKRHLSVRVVDNDETLTLNIRYRKAIFTDDQIELFKNLILTNIKALVSDYA